MNLVLCRLGKQEKSNSPHILISPIWKTIKVSSERSLAKKDIYMFVGFCRKDRRRPCRTIEKVIRLVFRNSLVRRQGAQGAPPTTQEAISLDRRGNRQDPARSASLVEGRVRTNFFFAIIFNQN